MRLVLKWVLIGVAVTVGIIVLFFAFEIVRLIVDPGARA
jgi:hypothetical protein